MSFAKLEIELILIASLLLAGCETSVFKKTVSGGRTGSSACRRTYFESFDNGCGGWLSDRGYRLNIWDGVAHCFGPWYLDSWHAPPGAGYLNLLMWIHTDAGRLKDYYPGYPGNRFVDGGYSKDLTNAKLTVRLRGQMDMQGAQLLVLVQAIQAEQMRANYVLTAQPFEVTPQYSEQTITLTPDPNQWVCMGARHDRKKYGPEYGCSSIGEVLGNVDVDIIFVLFPLNVVPVENIADKHRLRPCVDYHVEQKFLPKGLIMFDWVKIEYPS